MKKIVTLEASLKQLQEMIYERSLSFKEILSVLSRRGGLIRRFQKSG